MTKIRSLSQRYAVLFSVAVCVIFFLCMRCSGWIYRQLPQTIMRDLFFEFFDMLWPVALALLLGYGFAFRAKGFVNTLIPGMPSLCLRSFLVVFAVFTAFTEETQWQTMPVMLMGVVSMIGIGIREEVIFRGIIGNSLVLKYGNSTKGLWIAIILSAALFSGIHLQNLLHGLEPIGMIAQLIGAFGMGLVFMTVYVRGGNIWVPILIHAITDASGLFESTFTITTASGIDEMGKLSVGGAFILLPIHIALCMFLLRKSKRPAIFARLEQLREENKI